ncbi:MAG: RecQ family ATP-dependent DNA helicase [Candidatus Ozemobacteraceae bacterium]
MFSVGHNLLHHDLPWLREHDPENPVNFLVPVDTLFLAPLAFPRNPYHHLCKGYKPIDSSRNNPLRDSAVCYELLLEELDKLRENPLLQTFQSLFSLSHEGLGTAEFLHQTLERSFFDTSALAKDIQHRFGDSACQMALESLTRNLGQFSGGLEQEPYAISTAMALSWLTVCGEKSRLSPWVVHTFPAAVRWFREAREKPCGTCPFCLREHSTVDALKRYFGHPGFRTIVEEPPVSQKDVVEAILRGEDLLLVLATGGGKSLCYQLPALMLARRRNLLTLVISPLQSLMKDQVDILRANNLINVGTINGLLNMFERLETLEGTRSGDIDLLFVAPEQMRNESFCKTLRQREIGLIVVDEAHCFSKWGHDFRPDYLFICSFIREVVGQDAPFPPVACFTATAKPEVIEEIQNFFREGAGKSLRLIQSGIDRPNLKFFLHGVKPGEKKETIMQLLEEHLHDNGGAIIFTSTQNGARQLSEYLCRHGHQADFFHAGRLPDDKSRVQDEFKSGKIRIICATNAFCMGVDKADVRMVIHHDIPGSLENYLQEAGRAGALENADGAMLQEIEALVKSGVPLSGIAVLSFRNEDLYRFKSLADERKWPVKILSKTSIPLIRTREFDGCLEWLKSLSEELSTTVFKDLVTEHLHREFYEEKNRSRRTPWSDLLEYLIAGFWDQCSNPSPATLREFIFDASREIRQGECDLKPQLTLATMHASKGLEFDAVIVRLEGLGLHSRKRLGEFDSRMLEEAPNPAP